MGEILSLSRLSLVIPCCKPRPAWGGVPAAPARDALGPDDSTVDVREGVFSDANTRPSYRPVSGEDPVILVPESK